MRRDGTNGVAGTSQVNVDGILPICILQLQDRFECLDAGVSKQNVEPAEGSARLLGRVAPRCQVALIESRFASAYSCGFDQTARLSQLVRCGWYDLERPTDGAGNIDAHHIGPLSGKRNGRRASNSTGRTGDDRSLARQPS